MTERFGNPNSGSFSVSAVSGTSSLPLDWEHPNQWTQFEKYLEPALKEATKKVISMLMENSKSLEDFLAGTVYKINGGPLYGNVSVSGSLTVDGVQYFAIPVGSVMPFAGSTLPDGWLWCDGTAYSMSQYVPLFAALGSTYNTHCGASAPSSGYFRVPNYSGRVIVAKNSSDSTFDSLTDYGGEKNHTLTTSEMPAHTHLLNQDPGIYWNFIGTGTDNHAGGLDTGTDVADPYETSSVGGGDPHNNLQPYAVANYIIKY